MKKVKEIAQSHKRLWAYFIVLSVCIAMFALNLLSNIVAAVVLIILAWIIAIGSWIMQINIVWDTQFFAMNLVLIFFHEGGMLFITRIIFTNLIVLGV